MTKKKSTHNGCTAIVNSFNEFTEEHLEKNPDVNAMRVSERIVVIDGSSCQCENLRGYKSVNFVRMNSLNMRDILESGENDGLSST